jgi:hypothetical protein
VAGEGVGDPVKNLVRREDGGERMLKVSKKSKGSLLTDVSCRAAPSHIHPPPSFIPSRTSPVVHRAFRTPKLHVNRVEVEARSDGVTIRPGMAETDQPPPNGAINTTTPSTLERPVTVVAVVATLVARPFPRLSVPDVTVCEPKEADTIGRTLNPSQARKIEASMLA